MEKLYRVRSNIECNICLEKMNGDDSVAHTGVGGDKHPLHRECIKRWLEQKQNCPGCRVQLDNASVFNWKERVIKQFMPATLDAITGLSSYTVFELSILNARVLTDTFHLNKAGTLSAAILSTSVTFMPSIIGAAVILSARAIYEGGRAGLRNERLQVRILAAMYWAGIMCFMPPSEIRAATVAMVAASGGVLGGHVGRLMIPL